MLQEEQLHGTPSDSKEFANNTGIQLRHQDHLTSQERLIS